MGAVHDKIEESDDAVAIDDQVLRLDLAHLSEASQDLEVLVKLSPVLSQHDIKHILAKEGMHEPNGNGFWVLLGGFLSE